MVYFEQKFNTNALLLLLFVYLLQVYVMCIICGIFCNICLSTILHGYYIVHTMHTTSHTCTPLAIDLLNLSQSIKLNLSLIILVPNCLSIRNRWHTFRPINGFDSIVWLQNFVYLAEHFCISMSNRNGLYSSQYIILYKIKQSWSSLVNNNIYAGGRHILQMFNVKQK